MQRSVVQLQCGLRRGLALTCTYAPALRLAFAFAIALVLELEHFCLDFFWFGGVDIAQSTAF